MSELLPSALSAVEAIDKIRDGWISSVELVQACLDRISETDDQLHAWVFVDQEGALARAAQMDAHRKAGKTMGRLHGIPVGLKDIIDTNTMPTERGTPIFSGRQPDKDAYIVQRLLGDGAVILGKTVTTELAFMHANETRNPHDVGHSPGGSSSGSAAAVAAFQVPLAVGTQTNGSVIRPASYCGIYGFKPTNGIISRSGLLQTSKTLDQVGVFARSLKDTALLADILAGYDAEDENSFGYPRPAMLKGAKAKVPVEPIFATFDLPFDNRQSLESKEAFDEVMDALGNRVERHSAPLAFASLLETQATIHQYEICQHLETIFDNHWTDISETLKPIIKQGRQISVDQYDHAIGTKQEAETYFDAFFIDYDAILAPSATGTAPKFGEGTGDPAYCTIWTLAGLPCINAPLFVGSSGLPMGLQLIGASQHDDRLLRTTSLLLQFLQLN
jgi:Asp-tRNA(Asn)/Glu-tRNA(Gln) amidotransferase A subunit family amidase